MLSPEKNRLLTQVGPGTPMGELLRRYWMPIAASASSTAIRSKPVRLMGEDLVLYKDMRGRFGLVDRHCPHRRADLAYGFVEQMRHPLQLSRLADGRETAAASSSPMTTPSIAHARSRIEVRPRLIRCKRSAGLLWAYLGPAAGTVAAGLGAVHLEERLSSRSSSPTCPATGFNARRTPSIPCISNGCTTTGACGSPARLARIAASISKLEFEEFDYGFVYKRVREG